MKFIAICLIAALVYTNDNARTFIADSLQTSADFMRPDVKNEFKISF
jgi:hypothetical protein